MFSQGDTNEDGKISKDETLNFYERTSCVESFVVDGFTYKECTTEGYPEDTADLEKVSLVLDQGGQCRCSHRWIF